MYKTELTNSSFIYWKKINKNYKKVMWAKPKFDSNSYELICYLGNWFMKKPPMIPSQSSSKNHLSLKPEKPYNLRIYKRTKTQANGIKLKPTDPWINQYLSKCKNEESKGLYKN